MGETVQTVAFSVEQINQILGALGEIPAKYSLDLLTFIRSIAQEQLQNAAVAAVPEVPEVPVVPVAE